MPQNNDFQDDDCFNQLKTCLFDSFSCFFNSRRHEYQEIPEMPIPVKKNWAMVSSDQLVAIPAPENHSPDSVSELAPKRTSCLRSNSTGGITENSTGNSKNTLFERQVSFGEITKVVLIPSRQEYHERNLHKDLWHSNKDYDGFKSEAKQDYENAKLESGSKSNFIV
jgi:hypothetical protein